MSTGNVSIRLSVQDAATVTAALEKLGSDGAAALKKINDAANAQNAGSGLKAVDKTVGELKSSFEDAAKSIGPVGTFLTGLGPIGIAAAAGIAGVVAVIYEMSKAANELGQRAQQISNFAETTQLTTTAVQALSAEGGKFGLSAEAIAGGLQRFAGNLEAAHRGTGTLYDDLHRINPELAHQVAAAKDVASAYDILGRAIANAQHAGDTAQATALARAAFGRNPGAQGNLAADVSGAGGVNALASAYQAAGKALDEGLLKRLATLKTEIDETNQRAKDIAASLFSEEVLSRQLQSAQAWERMASAARDMADATKGEGFLEKFVRIIGKGSLGETGDIATADQLDQETLRQGGYRRLREAMSSRAAAGPNGSGGFPLDQFNNRYFTGGPDAAAAPAQVGEAAKAAAVPIEAVLADTRKWMAVLGSAATPAEQLKLKILELNVAVKDNNATSQAAARALAAFKDAQTAAAEGTRERLGLASEEEIYQVKLIQLNKDLADGYITVAEHAKAAAKARYDAEQQFKSEQVKNSRTPGLTQLGQFQFDDKAIDQVATRSLDNLDTTLVSVLNNTGKAGDAFRKFGLDAAQAIEQATIKALILAPLARSMAGFFGGFGGGGGVNPAAVFAEGGIMTSRGPLPLRRYAGGGVATSPQLAIFGEGSGPEAFVPLRGGAIPVQINRGGAAGHSVVINQTNNFNGMEHREIAAAIHEGNQRTLASAGSMIKNYDKSLPSRLADINQRMG